MYHLLRNIRDSQLLTFLLTIALLLSACAGIANGNNNSSTISSPQAMPIIYSTAYAVIPSIGVEKNSVCPPQVAEDGGQPQPNHIHFQEDINGDQPASSHNTSLIFPVIAPGTTITKRWQICADGSNGLPNGVSIEPDYQLRNEGTFVTLKIVGSHVPVLKFNEVGEVDLTIKTPDKTQPNGDPTPKGFYSQEYHLVNESGNTRGFIYQQSLTLSFDLEW